MAAPAPGLCRGSTSQLVVVDLQPRLTAAMSPADRERVLRRVGLLLEAATALDVPVVVTEQYPAGLGETEPEIARRLPEKARVFPKTAFSCCGAEGFLDALDIERRPQVVMAGMESHVCVVQTALELSARGFRVFVAEDGICSRDPANHANAVHRLRHAGVVVTNTESVVFEWLGDSRHEHFKALSRLVVAAGSAGTG